jgi:hypothetical protein
MLFSETNTSQAITRLFDKFTAREKAAVLSDNPANDPIDAMFFFFCPPHELGITFNGYGCGNLHTHAVS